jgi:CheY-like chemotaxis protein
VVEDSAVSSRLFCSLLEKAGYDVRSAVDGEKALATLADFQPDLILLDFLLPGISGLELARELKSRPATKDVIIIALTACSLQSDVHKAVAAGCEAYIVKPIDARTFVSLVRTHLDRLKPAKLA